MSDVITVDYDEHVFVHDGEEWVVMRGDPSGVGVRAKLSVDYARMKCA